MVSRFLFTNGVPHDLLKEIVPFCSNKKSSGVIDVESNGAGGPTWFLEPAMLEKVLAESEAPEPSELSRAQGKVRTFEWDPRFTAVEKADEVLEEGQQAASVLLTKDVDAQIKRWGSDQCSLVNQITDLKTGPHKNWWNKVTAESIPARNFESPYVYHYCKAFLVCVARSCAEDNWSDEIEQKARKAVNLPDDFPLEIVYLGPDCDPATAETMGKRISRRAALEIMWRMQALDVFRRAHVTKQVKQCIGQEEKTTPLPSEKGQTLLQLRPNWPKQLEGCGQLAWTLLKEQKDKNKNPLAPPSNRQICQAALDTAIVVGAGYLGAFDHWEAWPTFRAPAAWLQNRAIELALHMDRSPAVKALANQEPAKKAARGAAAKGRARKPAAAATTTTDAESETSKLSKTVSDESSAAPKKRGRKPKAKAKASPTKSEASSAPAKRGTKRSGSSPKVVAKRKAKAKASPTKKAAATPAAADPSDSDMTNNGAELATSLTEVSISEESSTPPPAAVVDREVTESSLPSYIDSEPDKTFLNIEKEPTIEVEEAIAITVPSETQESADVIEDSE